MNLPKENKTDIVPMAHDSYGSTLHDNHDNHDKDSNTEDQSPYWRRFQLPEATAYPVTSEEQIYDPEAATVLIAETKLDDRPTRHAFIRKVYSILSVQIFLTFGVCAFVSLYIPAREYVLENDWLYILSAVLSLILLFPLKKYKNTVPHNMVLLFSWTLTIAYTIGYVTSAYAEAGQSWTIVEALFLTGIVFFVLTLFTLSTNQDFSFMGAGLGIGLLVLTLWSFLGLLFGFTVGYVYSLLGTILFSGFIIFDTWMITERLDPKEYIQAVIELYLDIVNLFLLILELLSRSDRR